MADRPINSRHQGTQSNTKMDKKPGSSHFTLQWNQTTPHPRGSIFVDEKIDHRNHAGVRKHHTLGNPKDSLLPGSYLICWLAWELKVPNIWETGRWGCTYHITHWIGIHDVLQLHGCHAGAMSWRSLIGIRYPPWTCFLPTKLAKLIFWTFFVWSPWFQNTQFAEHLENPYIMHPQTGFRMF